jgi:hypothetical protein
MLMKMSVEQWWDGNDRGKLEVLGEEPVTVPLYTRPKSSVLVLFLE